MSSKPANANYEQMWDDMKRRLQRRVDHMQYCAYSDRQAAYQDVLLLMEDLEENV